MRELQKKNNMKFYTLVVLCVVCYIVAWINIKVPIKWEMEGKVDTHITNIIKLSSSDRLVYKKKINLNQIKSLQLYTEILSENIQSGNLDILITQDGNPDLKISLSKPLNEIKNNICTFEIDSYEINVDTYNVQISLSDVDASAGESAIIGVGVNEDAYVEKYDLYVNDKLQDDVVCLAMNFGGIVEEKTYKFDWMLMTGILFFLCILTYEKTEKSE